MNYIESMFKQTPTRLWLNNPNQDEMDLAITAGIRNVTTNPAYSSKLTASDAGYIKQVIDEIVLCEKDDDTAADMVCQKVSIRIMDQFVRFYDESGGKEGFVTIQLDPRQDEDPRALIDAADRHSKCGKNYMAKIPVTAAGLKAMEAVLKKGVPICATEIFSIAQAIEICELHKKVCNETGKHVPLFVTHITGIFDEYLGRFVKQNGISIRADALYCAGAVVGRKLYKLVMDRGYQVRILGGGARGIQHVTEFIGGDMDITVNWSTVRELINKGGKPIGRIDTQIPEEYITELNEKLTVFRKAYQIDGLSIEEFADYGPVQLFRNNFKEGYYHLLKEIAARRAYLLA